MMPAAYRPRLAVLSALRQPLPNIGAALVGLLLSACSNDEFSDCTQSRSCSPDAAGQAGDTGSAGRAGDEASSEAAGAAGAAGGPGAAGAAGAATNGGQGGNESAAGAGGAGGAGGSPECMVDDQCADTLACNGDEWCDAGICVQGSDFCDNPDPDHCDISCTEPTEPGGIPVCRVTAGDRDDDGHGSDQCTDDPGDDCDDTRASVNPTADEICDGRDNDCDGADDLSEGLELGGTVRFVDGLNADDPSIVWAPEARVYGIAWIGESDDGSTEPPSEVFITLLNADGTQAHPAVRLSDSGSAKATPDVAWNGESFAVVWSDALAGVSNIYFGLADAEGVVQRAGATLINTPMPSTYPAVAWNGQDWVVVWRDGSDATNGQILAQTVESNGNSGGSRQTLAGFGEMGLPRVAVTEGNAAVVWDDLSGIGPMWRIYDASLAAVTNAAALDAETEWTGPVVAPATDGYAIAWARPLTDQLLFEVRNVAGERTCETPSMGTALSARDLVSYAGGHLIAGTVTSGVVADVGILRVLDGCVRGSNTIVLSDVAQYGLTRINAAAGEQGFAVAWPKAPYTGDDPDSHGTQGVLVRTFGPNFCDDPTPAP